MELSIGNETHSLTLCANMVGFGKADHIIIYYAVEGPAYPLLDWGYIVCCCMHHM